MKHFRCRKPGRSSIRNDTFQITQTHIRILKKQQRISPRIGRELDLEDLVDEPSEHDVTYQQQFQRPGILLLHLHRTCAPSCSPTTSQIDTSLTRVYHI